jgi:hypothetical protein
MIKDCGTSDVSQSACIGRTEVLDVGELEELAKFWKAEPHNNARLTRQATLFCTISALYLSRVRS